MRSNDSYIGLPHDFFAFTMIQEIVARTLDCGLGAYKHFVGSLHLYEDDLDSAQGYINEGLQPTTAAMPAMPRGDPWKVIDVLLPIWTWAEVSANLVTFRQWVAANEVQLKQWRFGNHRKYESLNATSASGTPAIVESYVAWINPPRTHTAVLQSAQQQVGHDSAALFNYLYESMTAVRRFGRLARFDFLTMVAKVGLAAIHPPVAYLATATGPKRGARLLFGGSPVAAISPNRPCQFASEVCFDDLQRTPAEFLPQDRWRKGRSRFHRLHVDCLQQDHSLRTTPKDRPDGALVWRQQSHQEIG